MDARVSSIPAFSAFQPTASQHHQFSALGYVHLRDFFSEECAQFLASRSTGNGQAARDILRKIRDSGMSPGQWARVQRNDIIVVPEADDAMRVCRFEYIIGSDAAMGELVRSMIAPVVSALAGEEFILFKDKENEKAPGGGAFRPHQDFAAYQAYGPRYNISAMVCIDPATVANGCVQMCPNFADAVKSHPDYVKQWVGKRPLLHHYIGGPKNGDIDDRVCAGLTWEPITTSPRDLVLFDSFVPHQSTVNGTQTHRRAMFLTFNAAREGDWYDRYYDDKRANYDDPKFHVSTPTQHSKL